MDGTLNKYYVISSEYVAEDQNMTDMTVRRMCFAIVSTISVVVKVHCYGLVWAKHPRAYMPTAKNVDTRIGE